MLDASSCYQSKWKSLSPYDSLNCCDSCLEFTTFLNSPGHPRGLRATRKENGTAEAATVSAGNPSTRLQMNRGLLMQSIILSKCSDLSHDTVLLAISKNRSFLLPIPPLWNGLDSLQRAWSGLQSQLLLSVQMHLWPCLLLFFDILPPQFLLPRYRMI